MSLCQDLAFLPAVFSLGRPGDKALVLRIEPQTSRFQDGHAQEWFFFLAGEDQRAASRPSENFNHSEADRQILFRAIGEFIGSSCGGLDATLTKHDAWKQ